MTSLGPGFFKVADSKYCAEESCRAKCIKDPKCKYYYGDTSEELYARGSGGGKHGTGGVVPIKPPGGSTPFDLIKAIKELQGVEEYLFQKLEEVSAKNPGSKEGDQLIKEINRLTDLRNSLYGQLKILYADLANYSKIESGALKDQLASAKMLENRLNALKEKKARLTAASTDKLRMVEIGNYEYLRYSAHKSIMKVIAFTSLGVLFFSLLLKNKVVPSSLGSIGIILSLSIGVVAGGRQFWDIWTRDNMNYNRFVQPDYYKGHAKGDSIIAHDENFFYKLFAGAEQSVASSYADEMTKLNKKAQEMKRKATASAKQLRKETTIKKLTKDNRESFSGGIVRAAPPAGANNFAAANFN